MNHLDSSSNPSSTTSSTPSSPAPFPTSSNPPSATTPPNPSPGQRDSKFNFPGTTDAGLGGAFTMGGPSHTPQQAPGQALLPRERLLGARCCVTLQCTMPFRPDESFAEVPLSPPCHRCGH